MNQTLLIELLTEELPPKALKKLGESFASTLAASLKASGLAAAACTSLGTLYMLQALPRTYVLKMLVIGVGIAQLATPLAWVLSRSRRDSVFMAVNCSELHAPNRAKCGNSSHSGSSGIRLKLAMSKPTHRVLSTSTSVAKQNFSAASMGSQGGKRKAARVAAVFLVFLAATPYLSSGSSSLFYIKPKPKPKKKARINKLSGLREHLGGR